MASSSHMAYDARGERVDGFDPLGLLPLRIAFQDFRGNRAVVVGRQAAQCGWWQRRFVE